MLWVINLNEVPARKPQDTLNDPNVAFQLRISKAHLRCFAKFQHLQHILTISLNPPSPAYSDDLVTEHISSYALNAALREKI